MNRRVKAWLKIKNAIRALETRIKELNNQRAELEKEFITTLFNGEPGTIQLDSKEFPGLALRYIRVEGRRIDSDSLKREKPEIYEKFSVKYSYDRILTVQAGNEEEAIDFLPSAARKASKKSNRK